MAVILSLGRRCASLSYWPRHGVAVLAGALAVFSMAPFYVIPALVVAYIALAWLEDGSRHAGQSFSLGLAFGLGFHAAGLHWIYHAYLVPPADFAALGAPSVLGLATGMGLYYGAALALTRMAAARLPAGFERGLPRLMLLAVALALMEWLRGHLLTGFPWNQPAQALLGWLPLAQAAALLGSYGLNLVVLSICLLFAALGMPAIGRRQRNLAAAAGCVVIAAMAGGGMARLALVDAAANQPGVYLRIVQPNTEQSEKWRTVNRDAVFQNLLRLSTLPSERAITLVIWPETAVPFPLNRFPHHLQAIGAIVPKGGYVLAGAPRQQQIGERWRTFNSLLAVDDKGAIADSYDKAHLVPFGEYIPLNDLFGLGDTIGRGSFDAGPGPRSVALPGLAPFSPLICYEVIFAGEVVQAGRRPGWLLNVTNDAWFGLSIGPHQHLSAARMRAIEEGLPLVRAANTGISAVIDATGKERARLGLDKQGVIDDFLPAKLSATPYAILGDWMFSIAILVTCLIAANLRRLAPGAAKRADQPENLG